MAAPFGDPALSIQVSGEWPMESMVPAALAHAFPLSFR